MDFLKDFYDTEGPLGIPMKDAQAQALESLLKELPQDDLFAPGRLVTSRTSTGIGVGDQGSGVRDEEAGDRCMWGWVGKFHS